MNDDDEYLRKIGRVALLTAGQEVDLARQIEAGPETPEGRQAKDRLIEGNLRLVVSVANRYAGCGVPLSDLIQEGNVGLIRAAEKFDYTKGNKFSTYAVWWIRRYVLRALEAEGRATSLPSKAAVERDLQPDVPKDELSVALSALSGPEAEVVSMRFGLTDGRPKTPEATAKACGITLTEVHKIEAGALAKMRLELVA